MLPRNLPVSFVFHTKTLANFSASYFRSSSLFDRRSAAPALAVYCTAARVFTHFRRYCSTRFGRCSGGFRPPSAQAPRENIVGGTVRKLCNAGFHLGEPSAVRRSTLLQRHHAVAAAPGARPPRPAHDASHLHHPQRAPGAPRAKRWPATSAPPAGGRPAMVAARPVEGIDRAVGGRPARRLPPAFVWLTPLSHGRPPPGLPLHLPLHG
jgi:hypothetical protein